MTSKRICLQTRFLAPRSQDDRHVANRRQLVAVRIENMHSAASHRSPLIGFRRMILLRRCRQSFEASVWKSCNRWSGALKRASATQVPPPDLSRSGTADLCDIYHPENVDVIHDSQLKIAQPIFRSSSPPDHFPIGRRLRDYGGNAKCHGVISTVKCYENNPLVRKVLHPLPVEWVTMTTALGVRLSRRKAEGAFWS